ncbi:GTP-binding protein [Prevotella copri]|uniref:GTP-binding protein n=1 Tax=Segatella copri TaxID=165179 RepID=A0AAP3BAG6_9BACT|nr:GTP-binding protein [Segatella copri]MCW4127535.1 GTP-binding protein [Segatella copri]MCW4414497.1 GTP-binding protein [Segatella copri]MCW4420166.1 GTP-binding protein [Segatella copri]
MNNKEVPVLLLTGYLGSGKTTLLNKILANKKGIKFAVIVNDIGEVNIDAALIEKGGVVGQKDDSLVSLQNGCICCTLKMDLVEQLKEIVDMKRFDYIVIEASGICEPAPIAQTICSIPSLGPQYIKNGILRLDSIVTVVDALRMKDEFANGSDLMKPNLDEEDLASLVIQQMEFCNIILLNKAADVEPKELEHLKQIIRAIQPKAEIFECNYGDVDLDLIVNTHKFDWQTVATSAGWIQEIESERSGEEEHDEEEHEHHHHEDEDHEHHHHEDHEHGHHHHHHHDHDHDHEGGEVEEYGIGTFVYYRRKAFDLALFDEFVARKWPRDVVRAKGICYFADEPDMCYVFEQAGQQKTVKQAGQWLATMPADQLAELRKNNPQLEKEWDEELGDRMIKIVFIGQHIKDQKDAIIAELDKTLAL